MDALRFLCNLDDGARRNLVMELIGPFRPLSAEEAKAQVADQQKGQNTMLRRTKLLAELREMHTEARRL